MWKCTSAVRWTLCVGLVGVLYMSAPASAAAVGNATAVTAELKASASRQVYRSAPSPRRQGQADSGEAPQVGFYKVDPDNAKIPLGLHTNNKRPSEDDAAKQTRGRVRAKTRGGSRPNADFFEEDAETIDEKDLKGRGRARAGSRRPAASEERDARPGYRPFGGSAEGEDAELVQRRPGGRSGASRQQSSAPRQVGYRPYGGTEIVPPPSASAAVKKPKDDYHSDDDDNAAFEEPADDASSHSSYSSGSSSGDSSGSGDHDDYKGSSGAEEDDGESGHIEDGAGDTGSYKALADDIEDDAPSAPISSPAESIKEDLNDKLDSKKLDDIKPVEEEAEHGSQSSASTDAKSEDFVSAPHHHPHQDPHQDRHYVKAGEKKHNSEHHSSVGEKGKKGYKTKEAHESGEVGKHGKEAHKAHSQAKKGHKTAHLDADSKYAQKHESEKGKSGADFADKGKHKKGHSTKGFRTVHRKDEFKKDETFYDEANNSGHHQKKGAVEKNHSGKKGEKAEKKHVDSKLNEGKTEKEGEKGRGSHTLSKKGHKGSQNEQAHHRHESKGVKEGGEKAVHSSAHAAAGAGAAAGDHDGY